MCLTLDALLVFLNLIGPEIVSTEPGRYVVHATAGESHWIETDRGIWCTVASLERED